MRVRREFFIKILRAEIDVHSLHGGVGVIPKVDFNGHVIEKIVFYLDRCRRLQMLTKFGSLAIVNRNLPLAARIRCDAVRIEFCKR